MKWCENLRTLNDIFLYLPTEENLLQICPEICYFNMRRVNIEKEREINGVHMRKLRALRSVSYLSLCLSALSSAFLSDFFEGPSFPPWKSLANREDLNWRPRRREMQFCLKSDRF